MENIEKLPIPETCGEYYHVYNPKPDIYGGEDTLSFKKGTLYEQWITNDFSLLRGRDGYWHMFGITHPRPDGFTDDFNFDAGTVHEAEWQLFHAVSKRNNLGDCLYGESFCDCKKILYPRDRPGEQFECWAPAVIRCGSGYKIIYSPKDFRTAYSDDLYNWKPAGILCSGADYARDPYVYFENGIYYLLYVENDLLCRTSSDFINWSQPTVFQKNIFGSGAWQESPCLFKRNGFYYLVWCIYDGRNGCYDNRTFVFGGKNITDFCRGFAPIAILKGHASEIVSDENGNYYLASVFYPYNGVSIAKLKFSDER